MSTIFPTPDLSRRRLLQALALSPLLAAIPSFATSRPDLSKIIALEWLPAELLIALGVMPMGVADIRNYNLWVDEPKLPAQVIDVGQRMEPNMELMQQLKPSLLLVSQGYGPNAKQLAPIAPVLGLTANDGSPNPLQQAIRSLNKLASYLDLQERAAQHLKIYHDLLDTTRTQVQPFAQKPILLFSFLDTRHVLVFGKGSLFQEIMLDLGLTNAWQGESSFWGSVSVGIERLAAVKNAHAICFGHGDADVYAQVSRTPLWQSMPFVREKQLSMVPAVWFYGATFSAMRFCRILTATLGKAS
ncbi:Fe(3+)-hydroxamate ABC transporter substrate-binding protein FhuD [Ewingella allii]|uniref:Fe(3+)-hydroxamate ABC transporter substrate-binding protein FhuD n=1 Tax=Ewingella allii TaxID=3092550 RepID=UPI0037915313